MDIEVRLTQIHDPEKNFLIRVCMLTTDTAPGSVTPDSVVRQCAECDAKVWFATKQAIPVVEGTRIDGEILLCLPCTLLHQMIEDHPPKWIGPRPDGFPI